MGNVKVLCAHGLMLGTPLKFQAVFLGAGEMEQWVSELAAPV